MENKKKEKNFAYIDAANLHKGIADLGWKLDYRRFRIWLKEKYAIERAYIFIGLVPKHKEIYIFLQEAGFTLIFKETTYDGQGHVKGNCDADLVLWATRDACDNICTKSLIVSSDGDYASLINFLQEKNKLKIVLSPGNHCSILIKRIGVPIVYMSSKHSILALKEKTPDEDGTS